MNIYANHALPYIKAQYSVIPGKFGTKLPAIKEWTRFCYELPTEEQVLHWSNTFTNTNLDLCTGKASGIIALDFDSTDPEIIDLVGHMMPESPVERIGSKGWVRFFRYNGEQSFALKFNGEVVFEILSDRKKVTIPPSKHPSGMFYRWKDRALLDVKKEDLPLLPIGLVSGVQNKLKFSKPGTEIGSPTKLINGRNDALSSECARLIQEGMGLNDALSQLIAYDKENHETPLFTDITEFGHTEAYTNAGTFFFNHLKFVNSKRFRDHKEYEIPITASAVNNVYVEEILKKKEQKQEKQKKLNMKELKIKPPGALGMIYEHILANSYVPQPAFALSSALSLMSVLVGRKTQFQGVASNLYMLNIATSGAGKDLPMQAVKNLLTEINATNVLGAGDYVSDASLMDELPSNPVRLDIVDEASGLLNSATNSSAAYATKMADILCELFTCSTNRFLGRMTADGRKGMCDRPCVSLLCSTTPTGFKDSVNQRAIEKGLLGRFLIFFGNSKQKAQRVPNPVPMPQELKEHLLFWKNFQVLSDSDIKIGEINQRVYNIGASKAASKLLDQYFEEVDNDRISQPEDSAYLPIVSRLYQQMLKIALISACSRIKTGKPEVDTVDVEFAIKVMRYYREIMEDIVDQHIFVNDTEARYKKVYSLISRRGKMTQDEFNDKTRWLKPKERESILRDMITSRQVLVVSSDDEQGFNQIELVAN